MACVPPGSTLRYRHVHDLPRRAKRGVADHVAYLSPLTLQAWDIGLRPLSPPLIKMVKLLSESDRAAIKTEWMEVCRPFLAELLTLDAQSSGQGGYHFFCLEKI